MSNKLNFLFQNNLTLFGFLTPNLIGNFIEIIKIKRLQYKFFFFFYISFTGLCFKSTKTSSHFNLLSCLNKIKGVNFKQLIFVYKKNLINIKLIKFRPVKTIIEF